MIFSPNVEVDEHPSFHQPNTILITMLNRLHHTLTARTKIFGFHGFGLHVDFCSNSYIRFHKKITIVEVRSVTIEVRDGYENII